MKLYPRLPAEYRWPEVPARYLGLRKVVNFLIAQFSWMRGTERAWGHPHQLTMELTNVCNLSCPQCPTGRGLKGRKASMLSMDSLKRVMDELGPYAFRMDMHNWGEPLLNKDVFNAIRLCEDHGVMTLMSTNFSVPFDPEKAEAMVRSGLTLLSVSIDGPDQESYETYRVKGKLKTVLANVEMLQRAKTRLGARNPEIIWSYLVFRYNEHRVDEARQLARSYGMKFMTNRGGADDPEWETTSEASHSVAGSLVSSGPSCRFLYGMAVVNADLGVSPCCVGEAFYSNDDFGDIRSGSFREVWNGKRYRAARRLFQSLTDESREPGETTVCERCFVYTARKDGTFRSAALPSVHPDD
jgi:MoaA/NifB/PqqE/SkfB family radical SAM enzyme